MVNARAAPASSMVIHVTYKRITIASIHYPLASRLQLLMPFQSRTHLLLRLVQCLTPSP
jgi:hypothetical protein